MSLVKQTLSGTLLLCFLLLFAACSQHADTPPDEAAQAADSLGMQEDGTAFSEADQDSAALPLNPKEEQKVAPIPPCSEVQKAEIADRRAFINRLEDRLQQAELPRERSAISNNLKTAREDLASLIKAYNCQE